jgi:hypothetical protein
VSIPHHELKANEGDNEEPEENKEMHDSFSFVFRETTSPGEWNAMMVTWMD